MIQSDDRQTNSDEAKIPPFSTVVPLGQMTGEDETDSALLHAMAVDATQYILSFDWCVSVVDAYFGDGVGGVVAVFLFRILPAHPPIDEWLWVVVGDLPPAYFVAEDIRSPHDALEAYIWHRSKLVECILSGRTPPGDVMPVNVNMTRELAETLSNRLRILSEQILPSFRG